MTDLPQIIEVVAPADPQVIAVEVPTDPDVISVVVPGDIEVITVVVEGPQGPRGEGGSGGAGGSRYEHVQASEAAAWIVNHNLGHIPVVSVLTTTGRMMLAAVEHVSLNQARVALDSPMTGRAICV